MLLFWVLHKICMSWTESLRDDHFLIEKMMRALNLTAELLKAGSSITAPLLEQAIDFAKNFTNVCHHGREEDSIFPVLEEGGMPRKGGPIRRMLFENGMTRQHAENMEAFAREYLRTDKPEQLIADIQAYTDHVSQHLTKENFGLFVMADMMLKAKAEQVSKEPAETEEAKLSELGKARGHYEQLAESYDTGVRKQAQ